MPSYTGIGSRETPQEVLETIQDVARHFAIKGWMLRSGGAKGADSAFESGCNSVGGSKQIFLPYKRFNGNTSNHYHISTEAMTVACRGHKLLMMCLSQTRSLDEWQDLLNRYLKRGVTVENFTSSQLLNYKLCIAGSHVSLNYASFLIHQAVSCDSISKAITVDTSVIPGIDNLLKHPKFSENSKLAFTLQVMSRNAYQVIGESLSEPSECVVCWTPGGHNQGGTSFAIRLAEELQIPTYNLALPERELALKDFISNLVENKRIAKRLAL